jgi:ribonuclease HI
LCGIFINNVAEFILGFAKPLGIMSTSNQAELCGAMRAIEIPYKVNWHNLWLEIDSTSVVLAVSSNAIDTVPWALKNRWHNQWFSVGK